VAGTTFPVLSGTGVLSAGSTISLLLSGAGPTWPVTLVTSFSPLAVPFKGGLLWPELTLVLPGFLTDGGGQLALSATWPAGIPSAISIWAQFWYADVGAPFGFAGSNAVRSTSP